MTRAQMVDQACHLGMQYNEYQCPTTGKLVRHRTFHIAFIKSEFRRLKAEEEGFVCNVGAIFQNTNSNAGLNTGAAVEQAVQAMGSRR